jgi:hypothetical protein
MIFGEGGPLTVYEVERLVCRSAPTIEEYLARLGPWGVAGILRVGRWEYDPTTDDNCPLDERGVAFVERDDAGRWRQLWHVDGTKIVEDEVYHCCYVGSAELGWQAAETRVGSRAFALAWSYCCADEERWQSWRAYYYEVLETGCDPLGTFETTLRRAAEAALFELDLPLPPGS